MNWDAIGAIGEIVGAIGVIATLAYLAIQIRQNTKSLEIQSFENGVSEANSIRLKIAENNALTELYLAGLADPKSLSDIDREKFRLVISAVVDVLNVQFNKKDLNILNQDTWQGAFATAQRIMSAPGGRWYFEHYESSISSSRFRELLRDMLREPESK
ncbi:MAG: hypothetical protein R3F41_19080 [Gammaproteobacteria bacterium]|nr:hypothetical protein [Pseudomonadales bacterium]